MEELKLQAASSAISRSWGRQSYALVRSISNVPILPDLFKYFCQSCNSPFLKRQSFGDTTNKRFNLLIKYSFKNLLN